MQQSLKLKQKKNQQKIKKRKRLKIDNLISLGKISGVFGVKGWVKIHSSTTPREGIIQYNPWHIKRGDFHKTINILAGHRQGKTVVAQLDGIIDRNQATALLGYEILITPDQLKILPKDEYYWKELEGLTVTTTTGTVLGKVDYLIETGANDVLIVKGKKEYPIPYLPDDVIKSIDLKTSSMVVDWDVNF